MSESDNDPDEAKHPAKQRNDEGSHSLAPLELPPSTADNPGMEDAGSNFLFDVPPHASFHFIRELGGVLVPGTSVPFPAADDEFSNYTLTERAYGQAAAFERSLIGGSGSLDDFGKIMTWVYNDLITQKPEKSDT